MRRAFGYQFRRTTLWLFLFIGILLGLGGSAFGYRIEVWWIWVLACLLCVVIRKRQVAALVLIILLGLCCGVWRGSIYMDRLVPIKSIQYRPVVMVVRASGDAVYDKNKQLAFDASHLVLSDGTKLTGKVQVSGFGVNAVFQGDELRVTGKLYRGYGAYQGRISFAKLELLAHHPSLLGVIRQKFTAGVQTALPEPLAGYVMGLLVGQRATLPEQVKQDFLMVGLTHIIAVSGYNLTIILNACKQLFGNRSKRMTTFLSLALILTFLLLTAGSASIVRAAIVSVLSITAGYYGRTFKPLNLITLAAVITAWANPVYIWSDLGWYLSFLAFYGVMVLSPLIQARWPGRWHQNLVGSIALESICAEIMTLPFILHIFGQMSLIGLVANILVVTLVPFAMLLGAVAGVAGMLAAPVAGWFAWPACLILNCMLSTAHILASVPNIFIENRSLSLGLMLGAYVLVGLCSFTLWHKTKAARLGIITDIHESKRRGLLA